MEKQQLQQYPNFIWYSLTATVTVAITIDGPYFCYQAPATFITQKPGWISGAISNDR
jgi:hypothetical protein